MNISKHVLSKSLRAPLSTLRYCRWVVAGRPVPTPPAIKQRLVRRVAKTESVTILVETGTFMGDMLAANRYWFTRLVSIELSEDLWERAKCRLGGISNITLLHGDSADLLPAVIAQLHEPALFWLDAHYSAGITARANLETPIESELRTILATTQPGHLVLIDDARCFGQGDYPSLEAIRDLIAPRELVVEYDIIRFRV